MPQITEKGRLAKVIGGKDMRKTWVFEGISANCPPIKRERGDNCREVASAMSRRRSEAMARQGAILKIKKKTLRTATRKREKFIRGYWIVNVETRGSPCEGTQPTEAHGLLQALTRRLLLFDGSWSFNILTLIQFEFLRCRAQYKN